MWDVLLKTLADSRAPSISLVVKFGSTVWSTPSSLTTMGLRTTHSLALTGFLTATLCLLLTHQRQALTLEPCQCVTNLLSATTLTSLSSCNK